MTKEYIRTEDGFTTRVSVKEALAEVDHAMMGGRHRVREMSSGQGSHQITYRDGRKVDLREVDAKPSAKEFAATNVFAQWDRGHTGAQQISFLNNGGRSKLQIRPTPESGSPILLAPTINRQIDADVVAAAHAYAKVAYGRRADWPTVFTINRPA